LEEAPEDEIEKVEAFEATENMDFLMGESISSGGIHFVSNLDSNKSNEESVTNNSKNHSNSEQSRVSKSKGNIK